MRTLGIDIGAETVKVVEVTRGGDGRPVIGRRAVREHHKDPHGALLELLAGFDWTEVDAAAVTGRMSRQVRLPRIPVKQAQAAAHGHLSGDAPATVVSIGSHGFSVLELRSSNLEMFRENSRCSQGTGNFLRQLVERFGLTIDEASALCEAVDDPAPLSGRCPVILKTDMTHLANKGEPRERIVAGLYDAVCENVQVLVKPRVSPPEVVLIGGVSRSERIREHFRRFTERHGMRLQEIAGDDALTFEALGCAVIAATDGAGQPVPALGDLFAPHEQHVLEELPALSRYLDRVRRIPPPPVPAVAPDRELILGFDIGSTGSKIVAIEAEGGRAVWQGYVATGGAPVRAAQELMRQFVESRAGGNPVRAVGATGSGREIVGSLMTTCYGSEPVFVLNEIAAHAEGALQCDPRVDTIFEIGGQDAKYIRLSQGRVVDAAMNEACSAGTGSFIEEQGRKFQGIDSVVQLGTEALAAGSGVSLGQHCSVFMAEVIDEAVASGVARQAIIAGIYDSIIQNYLNRVKGSRSVGKVIFCQGMPFSSDALAAAVARQTGSEVIVPPHPGTVGALGIALLARKELGEARRGRIDPQRFLAAEVVKKDVFVCKSTKGCGGAGNRCRIDRIRTVVDGVEQNFTWGGGCSLYDRGTSRRKLPDRAPDPFREREELLAALRERLGTPRGRPTVALTDEFVLKGLFPFFATFIRELGFDPLPFSGADQAVLKRGIEDANVPLCAPLQQYHGLVSRMAEARPDFLFLPMQRHLPRVKDEPWARLCPLVQGSADMLRWDLGPESGIRIVSPVINIGRANLESKLLRDSLADLTAQLGGDPARIDGAWGAAIAAQQDFDRRCLELGRRTLEFCAEQGITPIVVLGRPYTIHNTVLNSNVPAILREQGAIPIPVDCYPVGDDVPIFHRIYWGFGQRSLRAAHQIRRTPGVWSLYCSNYSCGPDSFNLHLYGYIMEGKPFAIIETDGHSGDAGTKTRVEAFLYCVRGDREEGGERNGSRELAQLHRHEGSLEEIRRRDSTVLIPRMGAGAGALAACLRGIGVRSESLPLPDAEALALGRRHTSGKECIPMTVTLGSLLQRLAREPDDARQFTFFMPTANGPCRFGSYAALHRMVLDRLGYGDRVRIWAPVDEDYFESVPDGFAALIFAALCVSDALIGGLYHARPAERVPGSATAAFEYWQTELAGRCEVAARGPLTSGYTLAQVMSGRLFGLTDLLRRASRQFAALADDRPLPTVLVVGELYVRCDPFSNNFVIPKLERRGIRCRFAAFNEWLEYTDYQDAAKRTIPEYVSSFLQAAIQHLVFRTAGDLLGWHRRTTIQDSLSAAAPYIREQLSGEAALTLGAPLHEWREGHIDGVVSVGPLECMPNKVCEAQFFHVAERDGLLSLTLNLNGDPIDPEILDNFAYEVRARWRRRQGGLSLPPPPLRPRPLPWRPQTRVNPREP
jgi:predicted CoA-substrate-specific enzyme activase